MKGVLRIACEYGVVAGNIRLLVVLLDFEQPRDLKSWPDRGALSVP